MQFKYYRSFNTTSEINDYFKNLGYKFLGIIYSGYFTKIIKYEKENKLYLIKILNKTKTTGAETYIKEVKT